MATSKLKKMASIWKGHSIDTKVRILKCIVFPTATYGCEAWAINNTDSKKIISFEMNSYRKILRILWTQKVSNEEVLLRIGIVSPSLLQNVNKLKLSYFGHIKRHDSPEKRILEAKVAGRRGRGRPSRRWEQDIQEWMGTTITQAGKMAEDRTIFLQKGSRSNILQEDWLTNKYSLFFLPMNKMVPAISSSMCYTEQSRHFHVFLVSDMRINESLFFYMADSVGRFDV